VQISRTVSRLKAASIRIGYLMTILMSFSGKSWTVADRLVKMDKYRMIH